MVNEKEIIRRAANGDMEAFEIIVSLYEKKVYNLTYRNLGHEQDAMDACQEVFFKGVQVFGELQRRKFIFNMDLSHNYECMQRSYQKKQNRL